MWPKLNERTERKTHPPKPERKPKRRVGITTNKRVQARKAKTRKKGMRQ